MKMEETAGEPSSSKGCEEGGDEGEEASRLRPEDSSSCLSDMRTNTPPVRTVPIPLDPVQTCASATDILQKPAGCAALSFSINGRLVPPQPGGGSTTMTLRSLPGGSACGFTLVQTPTIPKPPGPLGSIPLRCNSTPCGGTAPEGSHAPIITDVVSGEAAHRVVSVNQDLFISSPAFSTSVQVPDSASHKSKPPPKKKPAPRHKQLHKGEQAPADCLLCRSPFKLISELRGFLCMCSPAITQSLKELKKKRTKPARKSREENKTSRKTRVSSELVSPLRSPRVLHSSTSPAQSVSPMQVDEMAALSLGPPPQGKLVILVEDFYYGSTPGNTLTLPPQKVSRQFHCTRCSETLGNNISLMSHTQQHQSAVSRQPASRCPHCLRHFLSPRQLQKHVEQAHLCKSAATCRICELAFDGEPDFLWHMRTTHKPGEMPYTCQVCDFRSSFYCDVWTHFQSVHANTGNLLCHFCLRVLRRTSCYQQHVAQHLHKQPFSCEKCRLHFLYVGEHLEHKTSKHTTHVKPPQLSGLKPGTKVTVRTYSVVGGVAPCKVVDVPSPPPPPPPPPKRRRVESLNQLHFGVDRDRGGSLRCTECLSSILDLKVHFPSVVTCSLCRFSTCCSASYANHMLSHHTACRGQQNLTKWLNSSTPEPSLPEPLKCVSCTLFTNSGDLMATHLVEQPHHYCIRLTHTGMSSGQSVCSEDVDTATETQIRTDCTEDDHEDTLDVTDSVTSLPAPTRAFIPVQLGPAHHSFSQLSIKVLNAPVSTPTPSAMTIKFMGPPRWRPEQSQLRPLSQSQLAVVLSSLCHGVSQAALLFQMSPEAIQSWTSQQQHSLPHRRSLSRTDAMVEWVLRQREKQLRLDEDVLLLMAKRAMELDGQTEMTLGRDQQRETRQELIKTTQETMKTCDGRDGQTETSEGGDGPTETGGDGPMETSEGGDEKTETSGDGQTETSGDGPTETSEGGDGPTETSGDGPTETSEGGDEKTETSGDGPTETSEGGDGPTETGEGGDGPTETSGDGPTETSGDGQTEMSDGGQTETSGDGPTETSEGGDGPTETSDGGQMKKLLWEEEQLLTCYNLTVDFMLRQELGQNSNHRTLTRNLQNRRSAFIRSLCSEVRTRQLPPQAVGCIDEFQLFVDLNLYQNQNPLALQFSKAHNKRPLLEVLLSALSDGTFLPPLLCFTGSVAPLPDGFPNNVVLEACPQGFTHQERMNVWIKKVWRPHLTSRIRGPSLLIVDPYRGPQNMKFRSRMSSLLTAVHYIPTGCCFSLQPLDVCVTPILRDFLQARWTQLVSDGGLDGLSLDHLALTLACWFSEVSSTLTSEAHFLSRSFSSVMDLQQTKDPTEVEKMITDLSRAMSRGPGGEVLTEMKAEEEERLVDSLSALRRVIQGNGDTHFTVS